jgi:hypothetical protein
MQPIAECEGWEGEEGWQAGLKQFTAAHAKDHALTKVYGAETKALFCNALIDQALANHSGWGIGTTVEALRAIRILMRERMGPDPASDKLVTNAAQGLYLSLLGSVGGSGSDTDDVQLWIESACCLNNSMFTNLVQQREFATHGARNERVAALMKVVVFGQRPIRCLGTLSRLLTCCVTRSPVFCEAVYRVGGLPVLVELLSACTVATSEAKNSAEDRKEAQGLATDVIKVLFALGHNDKVLQQVHAAQAEPVGAGEAAGHDPSKDYEAMTKMGLLLGDILGETPEEGAPLELKLQAVQLLMHMPAAFGEYMVNKGMVNSMVWLLEHQLEALEKATQATQAAKKASSKGEASKALQDQEEGHRRHVCQLCLVLQSVGQNSTVGEVVGGDGGARGALGRLIFPAEFDKLLVEARKMIEVQDKQALARAVSAHRDASPAPPAAETGVATGVAGEGGGDTMKMTAIQVELERIKQRRKEQSMHPEEMLLTDLGLSVSSESGESGESGTGGGSDATTRSDATTPLRSRLVKLMTSLDSDLKRCASELLFVACQEDGELFTRRVGFGNAVHILQLKSLIPAQR